MKKVQLDREDFAAALGKAIKFVDETNVIPMYDSMYLNIREGDTMEIVAANERMRIKVDVPCKASEPFEICVPAFLLHKTVAAFRDSFILITQKSEKVIEIKCGKSKYNITMDSMPENYQMMKFANLVGEVTIHQNSVLTALKACKVFTDEKHPNVNLSVINMAVANSRMIFTGAQSHYVCRVSPRLISYENEWKGVAIPVETAKKIIGLLSEKGEIAIVHSSNRIGFFCTGFEMVSVIHDGKYPDTEKFFEKKPQQHLTVSTLEFRDAVKRLKLFSSIDEAPTFRLTNTENSQELKLFSADHMGGKNGEESISINNPSQLVIDKWFNNEYTLDVLTEIDSAEVNVFFDNNPKSTAFIHPNVDNTEADIYSFLLSPVVKMTQPATAKV